MKNTYIHNYTIKKTFSTNDNYKLSKPLICMVCDSGPGRHKITVMKQQQQNKAEVQLDKKQTNIDKKQTNTHLKAKRELCKPHHLEDFVTSFGTKR